MVELLIIFGVAFAIAIIICVAIWKKESRPAPSTSYEQIRKQVKKQDEEIVSLLNESEEEDEE